MDKITESYSYYGCELPKMPDDTMVLGVTMQMKVMDNEGQVGYHEFAVNLSIMEQLGMLDSASDTVRTNIMRGARKP